MDDLLHVEELLTNRAGLLTASLGLFLFNCRGFQDKVFFITKIRQNSDSSIHTSFFLSLCMQYCPEPLHIHIGELGWGCRGGGSGDCKIKHTVSGNGLD